MKNNENPVQQTCQEVLPSLLQMQTDLEELFSLIKINFKEKLITIDEVKTSRPKDGVEQVHQFINKVLSATEELSTINVLINYREFGDILNTTIPLFHSLLQLLSTDYPMFYRESHRLLKYYWAIRYVVARFELESIPEFIGNQIPFFNMPDMLFDFIEQLKNGPKPVEILAEVDLQVRIDKSLPLLISRGPDEIRLSVLGEKFLKVHSLSDFYCYYLYEFDELFNSTPKH
ncbi:MAG: hypothetical protein HWN66_06470 [Candidatus Helarchaeota archaeon]|nr:hypothetical protein [Candidatus Helarchaeota archaeon]